MKRVVLALVVLLLAGAGLFWFLTSPDRETAGLEPVAEGAPDLANGEIVFRASGCESCHATPGQENKTRLGGGAPLRSPFGTFYPPNISPHKEDGIGSWTLAQFQRAMRGGVSPEGDHLYPAFPYTSYQRMTATDIRDLFGYMMTLPAVAGETPDHDLPFPLTVRRGIGLWKLAFFDGKVFGPIRHTMRVGTAALIWSKDPVTAPNATPHGMSSEPSPTTGASQAVPIPRARAPCPISPPTPPA